MARFDMDVGLDDFISTLSSVSIDALAPVALADAAPIVKDKMTELSSQHKDSGRMVKSIKSKKPAKSKDGYSLFTGPSGVDSKTGVRNMEKMAYLEYGVKAHNQPATPVITPTIRATEKAVCDSMQESFNKYMDSKNL